MLPKHGFLARFIVPGMCFPLVEQTSNSMRHQLVTPISFMPALYQLAYFTALVIVVFTAGKATDGFTPPSAYIAHSSPAKWSQQKGSFLVLFDQSVWYIQQQGFIPKFWWPIKISGSSLCCFWRGLWVAPDLCNSMEGSPCLTLGFAFGILWPLRRALSLV